MVRDVFNGVLQSHFENPRLKRDTYAVHVAWPANVKKEDVFRRKDDTFTRKQSGVAVPAASIGSYRFSRWPSRIEFLVAAKKPIIELLGYPGES